MLSFGNYMLLRRMATGSVLHMPRVPSKLIEMSYAVQVGETLEITQAGMLAAKGKCPPFPALGRVPEPQCFRCGFPPPLTLCVGDCA